MKMSRSRLAQTLRFPAGLTLVAVVFAACATSGAETTIATRIEQEHARERSRELSGETGRLIVICMDGTWNVPDDDTNVWQLHQIAKAQGLEGKVIAYYTEGVGTTLLTAKKGGKYGLGVDSRISDAYTFLCETWKPGDHLLLAGFSRGAYQARILAGVIDMYGIYADHGSPDPRADLEQPDVRTRCKQFLRSAEGDPGEWIPKDRVAHAQPLRGEWHRAEVDCLVCFDTVAAVVPLDRLLPPLLSGFEPPPHGVTRVFPTTKLALHAMALDETRKDFQVIPFRSGGATELQQVWFSGGHSDIGGGYEPNGQNQVVLAWVLENLPEPVRTLLGNPAPTSTCSSTGLPGLHNEDSWLWRTKKRSFAAGSTIHESVLQRIDCDANYRPRPDWWGRDGPASEP